MAQFVKVFSLLFLSLNYQNSHMAGTGKESNRMWQSIDNTNEKQNKFSKTSSSLTPVLSSPRASKSLPPMPVPPQPPQPPFSISSQLPPPPPLPLSPKPSSPSPHQPAPSQPILPPQSSPPLSLSSQPPPQPPPSSPSLSLSSQPLPLPVFSFPQSSTVPSPLPTSTPEMMGASMVTRNMDTKEELGMKPLPIPLSVKPLPVQPNEKPSIQSGLKPVLPVPASKKPLVLAAKPLPVQLNVPSSPVLSDKNLLLVAKPLPVPSHVKQPTISPGVKLSVVPSRVKPLPQSSSLKILLESANGRLLSVAEPLPALSNANSLLVSSGKMPLPAGAKPKLIPILSDVKPLIKVQSLKKPLTILSGLKSTSLPSGVKPFPVPSRLKPLPVSPGVKPLPVSPGVKPLPVSPGVKPLPVSPGVKPLSISSRVKSILISSQVKPRIQLSGVKSLPVSSSAKLLSPLPGVKPLPAPSGVELPNLPSVINPISGSKPLSGPGGINPLPLPPGQKPLPGFIDGCPEAQNRNNSMDVSHVSSGCSTNRTNITASTTEKNSSTFVSATATDVKVQVSTVAPIDATSIISNTDEVYSKSAISTSAINSGSSLSITARVESDRITNIVIPTEYSCKMVSDVPFKEGKADRGFQGVSEFNNTSNRVTLQFELGTSDIITFASQAEQFIKTINEKFSTSGQFYSKACILGIQREANKFRVFVVIDTTYHDNAKSSHSDTKRGHLKSMKQTISHLNKFNIKNAKILEEVPMLVTLRDQSQATGTNKIIIGAIVGVVQLLVVIGMVTLAIVIYRKKFIQNIEKIPLLSDKKSSKIDRRREEQCVELF